MLWLTNKANILSIKDQSNFIYLEVRLAHGALYCKYPTGTGKAGLVCFRGWKLLIAKFNMTKSSISGSYKWRICSFALKKNVLPFFHLQLCHFFLSPNLFVLVIKCLSLCVCVFNNPSEVNWSSLCNKATWHCASIACTKM